MPNQRQLFQQYLAQTSSAPMALEIVRAEGLYLFGVSGKKYLDLISGISVSNVGHRHPKVLKAIQDQMDKYLHLMVYGEYVQNPQIRLAKMLSDHLPDQLSSTYFVNSGSEAIEGAMKLAKRYTGRTEIIAFKNGYHGSTQGALSIMGEESMKISFRPLLPDIRFLNFNEEIQLDQITGKTACVIVEPIQGEAGIRLPENNYLKKLRKRCSETGTLLIFDEVQTGFGRTGTLFAFEQYNMIPDVLVLAKGMGGGMPIGAFIASQEIMESLQEKPVLGHITTFGGHPVCCAAAIASLEVLLEEKLTEQVKEKESRFRKLLVHPAIKEVRSAGLMIAVEFETEEFNHKVVEACIENGIITDWFLFSSNSLRIAPPLIIEAKDIDMVCRKIIQAVDENSSSV